VNELLDWILDTVQSVDPVARTLLAGLGIMLETSVLIGLIVPGDTIVLVASTAVDGVAEYVALAFVVIVGALIGESIGFALGRWFGPHIQHSRLGRRLGEENWARAQRYLDRRGGPAVFISRFLPVLHSLIPLTVGMSTMRYRKFMAWTVPACVIWAFAYVTVGSLAAGSYRELSRELHWAGYVFVAVIAAFLLAVWGVKKLLVRSEAKHMADAPETIESAEAAEAAPTMVVADGVARAVDVGVVVDDDDDGPDAEAPDPSNLDPKR
jgi:membrane-associated protein